MMRFALYNHDTDEWVTTIIYNSHSEAMDGIGELENVTIIELDW